MSGSRLDRVERLFSEALQLQPALRAEFVRTASEGDEPLEAEVMNLLERDAERRAGDPKGCGVRGGDGMPEVPGYKLLHELGQGGFGVVYLADQRLPVARRVAVKVLKPGMDSRAVLARFETERRSLARLEHPNIARIYDAGTTGSGVPFFAMEHVPGLGFCAYCDRERLTVRQRLGLFVRVCDGVQHAHQRGVLHRDLKPSNVLVATIDGAAAPKIIDLGIAKAVTTDWSAPGTLATEPGQIIGTPEYMSPEQADSVTPDIDTRSDIYSLGVMLYEILTGTVPFDRATLLSGGLTSMHRIIREEDPPRPSERAASMPGAGAKASARRTTEAALVTLLRGDLDWIVMRAMDKSRFRRYASASELAADIERHLRDEPVEARPPSTGYRVGKFVRRNRPWVIAACGIGAALAAGFAATAWGLVRAREAERLAASEAAAATDARRTAEEILSFVTTMLRSIDPAEAGSADTTLLVRMLDDASGRAARELRGQPAAAASVESVIGSVYGSMGRADDAEASLRRGLSLIGGASVAAPLVEAELRRSLAAVHEDQGLGEDALREAVSSLRLVESSATAPVGALVASLERIGSAQELLGEVEDAEKTLRRALELDRRAGAGAGSFSLRAALARVLWLKADAAAVGEARSLLEESRGLIETQRGADSLDVAEWYSDQGAFLLLTLGDAEGAEGMFRRAIEVGDRARKTGDPRASKARVSLGSALVAQRRFDEAAPVLREAIRRAAEGGWARTHPVLVDATMGLAAIHREQGRLDEAQAELEGLLAAIVQASGRASEAETPQIMLELGLIASRRDDLPRAIEWYSKAVDGYRGVGLLESPDGATALFNLASALLRADRSAEALPHAVAAERLKSGVLGPGHPESVEAKRQVAQSLLALGRTDEARALLSEVHAAMMPREGWRLGRVESLLGVCLSAQGDDAEAERLLREGLERIESERGSAFWETRQAGRRLALFLEQRGRTDEAAAIRARVGPDAP
jgi:non-specific serine/threonine protein kinase/serine/threonine-protein kinase